MSEHDLLTVWSELQKKQRVRPRLDVQKSPGARTQLVRTVWEMGTRRLLLRDREAPDRKNIACDQKQPLLLTVFLTLAHSVWTDRQLGRC